MELSQKMKEVESLQASAKRASSCRADITQKAEQYLSERNDLEVEVTDLVTQVLYSLTVEFVFCHRPAVTHIRTLPRLPVVVSSLGYLHDIND